MKLLRAVLSQVDSHQGIVATIGTFDGVHLGHQNLIQALKQQALARNLPLAVILFEPQPREYLQKQQAPARLTSLREKLEVLKQCQVDRVYCIKFDHKLAATAATDFAKELLFNKLGVKYLIVGADFRFGKEREGDLTLLQTLGKNYGCQVQRAEDYCLQGEKVSSTKIRKALLQGDLTLAAQYLGRPYSFCGRVVAGHGRGAQWNIPTANLSLHRQSLPLAGVFVVQVSIDQKLVQGVANVGNRPTVDGSKNILEVHLFDFNASLYGHMVQVFFLHKLRDEKKFSAVDALITQIRNDIQEAKAYFANRQHLNFFAE